MGFRARKSIKVAPGVRLNLSKTGIGASVGGSALLSPFLGMRHRVGPHGIPGVYYQKGTGARRASPAVAAPSPKKPGPFAPRVKMNLYNAVKAQDVDAIKRVGERHPDFRLPAYSLAGLLNINDNAAEAERLLDDAFATGNDRPTTSSFRPICSPSSSSRLPRGSRLSYRSIATLSDSLWPRSDRMWGTLTALSKCRAARPTTYAAVSLAELYAQTGRWDDVIDLTEGVKTTTTRPRCYASFAERPSARRVTTMPRTRRSRKLCARVPAPLRFAISPSPSAPKTMLPRERRRRREKTSNASSLKIRLRRRASSSWPLT